MVERRGQEFNNNYDHGDMEREPYSLKSACIWQFVGRERRKAWADEANSCGRKQEVMIYYYFSKANLV